MNEINKRNWRYCLSALTVFAVGLFAAGVLSKDLGNHQVTRKEVAMVHMGMSYKEALAILGDESEREESRVGQEAALTYTWPVYSGDTGFRFSISCIEGKIVRIMQSTDERL